MHMPPSPAPRPSHSLAKHLHTPLCVGLWTGDRVGEDVSVAPCPGHSLILSRSLEFFFPTAAR